MQIIKYESRKEGYALKLWFEGKSIKAAAAEVGITPAALTSVIHDLECRHPLCTENHACRAAKRASKGIMICTALTDTDFDDVCPFYKTDAEYMAEFTASNKLDFRKLLQLGYI